MESKRKNEESNGNDNIFTSKRQRPATICMNDKLLLQNTKRELLHAWEGSADQKEKQSKISEDSVVFVKPYKLCNIKNFISDDSFLQELKEELFNLELTVKCNDLYQYQQSADLSTVHSTEVRNLKDFMQTQCKEWLQEVTGKQLTEKITLNFSTYSHTDYLLCHDDQTDDRLIAFVLYLGSKNWSEEDGGHLQLFDTDENNQPGKIVQSISPEYNSFVFFEVTSTSFHQVAEVLTADRTRLSINGWFHGVPNPLGSEFIEPQPVYFTPNETSGTFGDQLLNEGYMDSETLVSMSTHFEEESEILLADFLLPDQYMSVALALQSEEITWISRGPANRRNYKIAKEETLPNSVLQLVTFLKSEEMFQILANLTNLDLSIKKSGSSTIELPSSSDNGVSVGPRCVVEVQCWESGCYTMVHDNDNALKEQALDLTLYFNAESVEPYHGGSISYIARDDDEELLTVLPQGNSLALTFRDTETLRFVKYINSRLDKSDLFHTISITYFE